MDSIRQLNEYLYYEFGFDIEENADERKISDLYPFHLEHIGSIRQDIHEVEVYRFTFDEEAYFVVAGPQVNYFPVSGMTLEDLETQFAGSKWLKDHNYITLEMSLLNEPNVPTGVERREYIINLIQQQFRSADNYRILHGVFLRATGESIAIIEEQATQRRFILRAGFLPQEAMFPNASSWRNLCYIAGKMYI